jgi:DNA translocase ftsK 1
MLDQPQSSKSEDFFIQEKKQYKNGSSRFIKGLLLIVISVSFLILLVLCLTLIYSLSFQIKSNTLANQILGHSLGTYAILLTRNYYSIFGFSGLWCILFFICFLLRHFWHYSQHSSYSYFKVFLGLILFLLSSAALEHLLFFTYLGQYFPFRAGGIAGSWLAMLLKKSIGTTSSIIAFLAILFISCILLSQCKLTRIFFRFKYFLFNKKLSKDEKILVKTKEIIKTPIDYFKFAKSNRLDSAIKNSHFFSPEKNIIHLQKAYENYKSLIPNAFNKLQEKFKNKKRMSSPYFQYDNIIDKQKKLIISILEKEGIKINLVQTNIGPTFTHYQLDIDRSIDHSLLKKACSSLQELTTSSHITLCQSSVNPYSCELLIAHNKASRISLVDIFLLKDFTHSNYNLLIALGKDSQNNVLLFSLRNLPHLLVISSKYPSLKLAINAIIHSLVIRHSTKELRLILISKKESNYREFLQLPHLLTPLIKEKYQANKVFSWCRKELKKRKDLLKEMNCQSIEELNQKIVEAHQKSIFLANPFSSDPDAPDPLEILPFIVVLLDGLHCLEQSIENGNLQYLLQQWHCYTMQLGIHLVLTESSSVNPDLYDELAALFPTRLCFKLDNSLDSRLLLGEPGAEDLIDECDAYFRSGPLKHPIRLRLATLTKAEDIELNKKLNFPPEFDETILNPTNEIKHSKNHQKLYDFAVHQVLTQKKTSNSFLQRQLKIGYNLAEMLLQEMVENGILSESKLGENRTIQEKSFTSPAKHSIHYDLFSKKKT